MTEPSSLFAKPLFNMACGFLGFSLAGSFTDSTELPITSSSITALLNDSFKKFLMVFIEEIDNPPLPPALQCLYR